MTVDSRFPLRSDHFSGGSNLTPSGDSDLSDLLNGIESATQATHVPTVTPSDATSQPGLGPAFTVLDTAVAVLSFTLDTDSAFRTFKIPYTYAGNPSFHVHWTKTGDADESGKAVRWKISYNVFDGETENAAVSPTIIEVEDTYDDASTGAGSRIIYRTPNQVAVGFIAGHYVSLKVEAITPVGTPLVSEPALFSVDLIFSEYVNRGTE